MERTTYSKSDATVSKTQHYYTDECEDCGANDWEEYDVNSDIIELQCKICKNVVKTFLI